MKKLIANKPVFIAALVIGLCIILFIVMNIWLAVSGRAVDPGSKTTVIVEIEQGSSTQAIADTLADDDLIRSTLAFKLKSKISFYDGKYMAGQYAVSKAMSMKEMMEVIMSGKSTGQVFQTIEGQTIDKIADLLSKQGIVDKEDFYNEVENGEFDYKFMKYLPDGPTRLEGFLYPDQYQVSLDADAHEVIDIMLKQFDNVVTDKYYEEAEKKNVDFYDLIITASIIEREASVSEEKPLVSSVIYNRLKVDMPLQMDSIISYIHKEDKIKATYSDISVDSDYNPYQNKGLPPGPICSPGIEAIDAALYPEDTEYLFFVASEKMDGSNVYSKTYEEFLKDKEKFDKAYEEYIKEHPDKE